MSKANPIVLAFVLSVGINASPMAQTVTGDVRVIDGDTFEFRNTKLKVRIYGMDTLEKNQKCQSDNACVPCGERARAKAIQLIGKTPLTCELRGEKSYDREVASCTVNGKDYAQSMIESGWALAYRNYLPKKGKGHEYVVAEEKAKSAGVGLWSMQFISPADWRNRKVRLECER